MQAFSMERIRRAGDWLRVFRLYREAFPRTERKPLGVIMSMHRRGKTDVWCMRLDGRFAGFATTINGDGLIMIDYLAVARRLRGQGIGAGALEALCASYDGKGVFAEIESPFEPGDDQTERIRRKAFYERCGFTPSRTTADVFGVRFELMCMRCSLDFETYHAFYKHQYSAWAAEHIKYAPYPEMNQ